MELMRSLSGRLKGVGDNYFCLVRGSSFCSFPYFNALVAIEPPFSAIRHFVKDYSDSMSLIKEMHEAWVSRDIGVGGGKS
jgi:hypothetical protein